jgi:hypothetical protein
MRWGAHVSAALALIRISLLILEWGGRILLAVFVYSDLLQTIAMNIYI